MKMEWNEERVNRHIKELRTHYGSTGAAEFIVANSVPDGYYREYALARIIDSADPITAAAIIVAHLEPAPSACSTDFDEEAKTGLFERSVDEFADAPPTVLDGGLSVVAA